MSPFLQHITSLWIRYFSVYPEMERACHVREYSDGCSPFMLESKFLTKRPFLATCKQLYRETENREHFLGLLSSFIPSAYTTLLKQKRIIHPLKENPLSQEIGYARVSKTEQHLMSLKEDVNTSTPTGMLFFQLIAMLAEFEHNSISKCTKGGVEAASARGRKGGRPKLKTDAIKIAITKQLHASNITSVKKICHTLHISKPTLYRYLKM